MRLDVAVEIVRNEVVVPLIGDGVAQGCKPTAVAKRVIPDGIEDTCKIGIELEGAVRVAVAKVFNVFGEVAEKEDVGIADFAGDFNLDI